MMNKQTRTCIVCKNKFNQNSLIRIVKNKNGKIVVQDNEKLDGRGAYICKDQNCYENLIKAKALNRAFKQNIEQDVYANILERIKK